MNNTSTKLPPVSAAACRQEKEPRIGLARRSRLVALLLTATTIPAAAEPQYWDGVNTTSGSIANGRGGDGTWNASNTNWTNQTGTFNAAWAGREAVFAKSAASDSVTVEGSQTFTGMTFLPGANYNFTAGAGGALFTTTAATVFDIQGASDLNSIGVAIGGTGGLVKTGAGALALTATNTYSGGTVIKDGVLRILADANLGDASGALTLDKGTLDTSAATSIASSRAVRLNSGGGNFRSMFGSTLTLRGVISGTGGLTKESSGVLILKGINTYSGGTRVRLGNGVVRITDDRNLGDPSGSLTLESATIEVIGNITSNRAVRLEGGGANGIRSTGTLTLNGTISGYGTLAKEWGSTLVLTGINTYTGNTVFRDGGVIKIVDDRNLGASSSKLVFYQGALETASTITSNRSITTAGTGGFVPYAGTTLTLNGVISGAGSLTKAGAGSLIFLGTNTYTGGTTIKGGVLQIGNGGTRGSLIGNVNVWAPATLVFNRNDDLAFGGMASGAGHVIKDGSGMLTLSGANTHTGGTTIRNGTLQIGNGGDTGSLSGDVNVWNSATLAFNRRDDLTFSGIVSGAGQLVKDGAGTLTLSGESTYTGATTIRSGTLQVDGSTSASSPVTVDAGGGLAGSGTVAGAVTVADGGRLAGMSGQTLTMGALALNNGSHVDVMLGAPSPARLFNVLGDLTLDGTLNVSNAGGFGRGVYRLFDYGGALTDNGLAVGAFPAGMTGVVQTAIANQINLMVTGRPTVNNVITAPARATPFWNGTTTSPTGTVEGGSGTWSMRPMTNWTDANGDYTHTWDNSFAIFQGGRSLSNGEVVVDNSAGTVSATGMQFIGSGWTITGNALTMNGAGGTTTVRVGDGSAAGAADRAVVHSALIGATRLVKDDLGTLILTGENSYGGGTVVKAGALMLGDGHTTGSITGDIRNDGTLVFNRSNNMTYVSAITGTGAIHQTGGGMIDLTGDSGGFSGTTIIQAGTLAVNGALGGTLGVTAGGRLQGNGRVGPTTAGSGGTIAPGNSIGTLTVAGNVTFAAGSTYEVEVDAAGQSDRIDATGTAAIDGGTVRVLAGSGNYAPSTTYTILTAAAGRTGTFAGVTSNLAFLTPSLEYDPAAVYLTLSRNDTNFAAIGATPNQIAAGSGVESLRLGNAIYDAVLGLSEDQARTAFDQLSGEVHASAKGMMIEDSRFVREAAIGRLRTAFDSAGASPAPVTAYGENGTMQAAEAATDRFAVWSQGFGSWGSAEGDGNAAGLSRSIGGFLIGADGPVSDNWHIGVLGGYSHSGFAIDDRRSSGSSDNYHLGLYGGAQWGDFALRAGAAYTWHDLSTRRTIAFPGFSDALKGKYSAGTAQVFGEAGYSLRAGQTPLGDLAFEPFANLAHVSFTTDGFSERGGTAALAGARTTTDATFATLGLRASTQFALGSVDVTARGTLGWRHAFGDTTPLANLAFAGGSPFTIAGVPIARDAAIVEAGLDFNLSPNATLGISYSGQFSSHAMEQSLRANLNVRF